MSPETGFARFSSFTSLRRVPRLADPKTMLALPGSSADAQREKARWVVCRSEVKEEGCAQRRPGDVGCAGEQCLGTGCGRLVLGASNARAKELWEAEQAEAIARGKANWPAVLTDNQDN